MDFYLHDSYTLLLIYCVIIFSALIFHDSKRIQLALEYFFNQKYSILYHRKDSILYQFFTSINISIIFAILISFYILDFSEKMSWKIFVKSQVLLLLFCLIKWGIIYFLGVVFDKNELAKKYYYGHTSNLFICSICIFPLIIFFSYFKEGDLINLMGESLTYLCAFLYLTLKIQLFNKLNVVKIKLVFYNILYLCLLEIAPYFILLQLVHSL